MENDFKQLIVNCAGSLVNEINIIHLIGSVLVLEKKEAILPLKKEDDPLH